MNGPGSGEMQAANRNCRLALEHAILQEVWGVWLDQGNEVAHAVLRLLVLTAWNQCCDAMRITENPTQFGVWPGVDSTVVRIALRNCEHVVPTLVNAILPVWRNVLAQQGYEIAHAVLREQVMGAWVQCSIFMDMVEFDQADDTEALQYSDGEPDEDMMLECG